MAILRRIVKIKTPVLTANFPLFAGRSRTNPERSLDKSLDALDHTGTKSGMVGTYGLEIARERFGHKMIQDISPYHLWNQYKDASPQPGDFVLAFCDEGILLAGDEGSGITFLRYEEAVARCAGRAASFVYLFSVENAGFFLLLDGAEALLTPTGPADRAPDPDTATPEDVAPKHASPAQGNIVSATLPGDDVASSDDSATKNSVCSTLFVKSVAQLRTMQPRWAAFACLTGYHLAKWYRERRFCGLCGATMQRSPTLRSMVCSACGTEVFPTISPGIIVGIRNGERLLLVKYADRPYKNYGLVAGFVEIGETLEDTVRREVSEEVGLKVRNIRYFASQPWAFSQSLLVGFFADVDGSDAARPDGVELGEATWFERAQVPSDISAVSLTGTMIEAFRLGKD